MAYWANRSGRKAASFAGIEAQNESGRLETVLFSNVRTVCRALGVLPGHVLRYCAALGLPVAGGDFKQMRRSVGLLSAYQWGRPLSYFVQFATVLRLPLWALLLPPDVFRGWFGRYVAGGCWELVPGCAVIRTGMIETRYNVRERWPDGRLKKGGGRINESRGGFVEVLRGGYYVGGIQRGPVVSMSDIYSGDLSGVDPSEFDVSEGSRSYKPHSLMFGNNIDLLKAQKEGRLIGGRVLYSFRIPGGLDFSNKRGAGYRGAMVVHLLETDEERAARARGAVILSRVPLPCVSQEVRRMRLEEVDRLAASLAAAGLPYPDVERIRQCIQAPGYSDRSRYVNLKGYGSGARLGRDWPVGGIPETSREAYEIWRRIMYAGPVFPAVVDPETGEVVVGAVGDGKPVSRVGWFRFWTDEELNAARVRTIEGHLMDLVRDHFERDAFKFSDIGAAAYARTRAAADAAGEGLPGVSRLSGDESDELDDDDIDMSGADEFGGAFADSLEGAPEEPGNRGSVHRGAIRERWNKLRKEIEEGEEWEEGKTDSRAARGAHVVPVIDAGQYKSGSNGGDFKREEGGVRFVTAETLIMLGETFEQLQQEQRNRDTDEHRAEAARIMRYYRMIWKRAKRKKLGKKAGTAKYRGVEVPPGMVPPPEPGAYRIPGVPYFDPGGADAGSGDVMHEGEQGSNLSGSPVREGDKVGAGERLRKQGPRPFTSRGTV